ncbi:zinc-ribbon domain-containing protein [Sinomonas albida]|uniref:zinc-ribbon domain-containing protein n=1 Tax=Sinomonas albida TaxID=369942 RepID=UPI00301A21AF
MAGRRTITGVNDLATLRPDLAAEWDFEKNVTLSPTTVSPGSEKSVWWRDALGHQWQARINNRAHGTGCPFCGSQKVLSGFNDLATKQPHLAAEWDFETNGMGADEVMPSSSKMAWWKCTVGHSWEMRIANRTHLGQGCPVCSGQKVLMGFNDMATTAPELAAEFHATRNEPHTPQTVFRSTAKKFWWRDALGHEWQASANERSNGSNCPYCSGQRILVGFNDLGTRLPELAAEWHPELNGQRTPQMVTVKNGTRAWWRCMEGHEWSAIVSSRSSGAGCPTCAGQVVRDGINDLACLWPDIAAQWHEARNDVSAHEVMQYSNKKFWFICRDGHEWISTVNNRTHGQGCPECAERGGFNQTRPGYLYFLHHAELAAHKVGITNTDSARLSIFQLLGWEILHLELFEEGRRAALLETRIKKWWYRDLGLSPWLSREDMARTGGSSETIGADELTAIECIERIRRERRDLELSNWAT